MSGLGVQLRGSVCLARIMCSRFDSQGDGWGRDRRGEEKIEGDRKRAGRRERKGEEEKRKEVEGRSPNIKTILWTV